MDKTINYLWNGNPPAFLLKDYSFSGTEKLLHDIQKEHTEKIFHSFPTRGWQIETNLALDLGARFPVLSTPMVEVLTYLVNEGFLEMKLVNDIRHYRRKGKNSSDNK